MKNMQNLFINPVFVIVGVFVGFGYFPQLIICSDTSVKLVVGVCLEYDNGPFNESVISHQLDVLKKNGLHVQIHRIHRSSLTIASFNEQKKKLHDVSVLIGARDPTLELVAEEQSIPYLMTSSLRHHQTISYNTLHLVPSYDFIIDVCKDLSERENWKDTAILYDNENGLKLLGELMMTKQYSLGTRPHTEPPSTLRGWRVEPSADEDDVRETLLTVRQLNIKYFIVVCGTNNLVDSLLNMAMRLSMLSNRYSWTIANLPSTFARYQDYKDTQVNLTSILIFDDLYGNSSAEYKKHFEELMISEGFSLLSAAAEKLKTGHTLKSGTQMLDTLKETSVTAKSGLILFNPQGQRMNVSLRIKTLTPNGLLPALLPLKFNSFNPNYTLKRRTHSSGEWYSNYSTQRDRLYLSFPHNLSAPPYKKGATSLSNRNVKIVTILTDPPFMMARKGHENAAGNMKYDGFLWDMIYEISKQLSFTYELYPSPDGNYGSKNEKGEWNGMIRELQIGNASMCLGAISITAVREEAVDFTKPFKQKQFNFLMRKPSAKTSAFQFLWPLSTNVWLLTISAIFAVGLLLFLMDRLSPNSKHSEERFDLHESLFFTYGTLVGPGTEMVPRTFSGRVLSMAWWFFGMIIVSSYTANLAAFLTVTKIETPIKNVADLAAQRKIKYGTVKNTYANSMFRSSQVEVYKKMWAFMSTISPDSMVANASEGIAKIRNEDYAFIWDQPINDYITMNECDLWSTGTPFDEKGYGIGVPLGASYRDELTMVILGLQETGRMKQLEDKWWGGGVCQPFTDTATGRKELNIHNVAGVFYVLGMGAGVALLVCFIEFIYSKITRHMMHMKRPVSMMANDEDHKLNSSAATDNV